MNQLSLYNRKPYLFTFTTIAHIFYPGSWEIVTAKCKNIFESSENLLISSCYAEVIEEIEMPGSLIFKVPNYGKDIGGKLVSLKYYLDYCKKSDLLIFLHDKISPQNLNADYWFNHLFSIFQNEKFEEALSLFERKKKIGMIGTKLFIKNEYVGSEFSFNTTNSDLLLSTMNEFDIRAEKYDFVAGSIFIIRSTIYEEFFRKANPLCIRSAFEQGNVLDLSSGTYTHTWERLLGFIVESGGYEIAGI